jgi:hypothetical protein
MQLSCPNPSTAFSPWRNTTMVSFLLVDDGTVASFPLQPIPPKQSIKDKTIAQKTACKVDGHLGVVAIDGMSFAAGMSRIQTQHVQITYRYIDIR